MTLHILPAFGELLGYSRSGEQAARDRGDTAAARGNRRATEGLMRQVKPPRLLPRDTDEALEWRAFAHKLADHAWQAAHHSFDVVSRQGSYARRLDALAAQRGRE